MGRDHPSAGSTHEVASEQKGARRLGRTARQPHRLADRGAGVDLEHTRRSHRTGNSDQHRVGGGPRPRDQGDMGEGFHVLHKRGGAGDTALASGGWCGGGSRDASVDEVRGRARFARHVAGRCTDDPDQTPFAGGALSDCLLHRAQRGVVTLADVQDDLPGVHRGGAEESAVEDQVRARGHQQAVLLAVRLAFSAVDDDHRRRTRCRRDRPPLEADWKAGAASACQARVDEQLDEGVHALGERAEPAEMRGESFGTHGQLRSGEQPKTAHLASRRSTPA